VIFQTETISLQVNNLDIEKVSQLIQPYSILQIKSCAPNNKMHVGGISYDLVEAFD
jgi:hypothetical protein